jgi:crotonobetainyl-CoA:carnitine CoA-transferase CaiB-like acyl-CoA transferase
MHAPDFQTGILAGLWGFIAAASSVLGRMQDGHGRNHRLSIFESSIAVTEYIMFESFSRGDIMRRIVRPSILPPSSGATPGSFISTPAGSAVKGLMRSSRRPTRPSAR